MGPPSDPRDAFARLRGRTAPVWLDAAGSADDLGGRSFVACDPVDVIRVRVGEGDAFAQVEGAARGRFAIGYFGYDLGRALEPVPERLPREEGLDRKSTRLNSSH